MHPDLPLLLPLPLLLLLLPLLLLQLLLLPLLLLQLLLLPLKLQAQDGPRKKTRAKNELQQKLNNGLPDSARPTAGLRNQPTAHHGMHSPPRPNPSPPIHPQ